MVQRSEAEQSEKGKGESDMKPNRDFKAFLRSLAKEGNKAQAMQERFAPLGYYEEIRVFPVMKHIKPTSKTTGCDRVIGRNALNLRRYDYAHRNGI